MKRFIIKQSTRGRYRKLRHTVAKQALRDQKLIPYIETLNPKVFRFVKEGGYGFIYSHIYQYISAIEEVRFRGDAGEILDWGCGKGVLMSIAKNSGMKMRGCEIKGFPHTELINKDKLNIDYVNPEVGLPYKDGQFKIIVFCGVLEHVPHDQASLQELFRILSDDGVLIGFHIPSKWGWINKLSLLKGINYHDRLYSVRELRNLLKRSGFKDLDMWRHSVFPKNRFHSKKYEIVAEKIDQIITRRTPVGVLATHIEFIASKQECITSDH